MSNGYVDKARVLGTDYDIHVPDGAITRAKLDADLKEKTDSVSDLKSSLASAGVIEYSNFATGSIDKTETEDAQEYVKLTGTYEKGNIYRLTFTFNSITWKSNETQYLQIKSYSADSISSVYLVDDIRAATDVVGGNTLIVDYTPTTDTVVMVGCVFFLGAGVQDIDVNIVEIGSAISNKVNALEEESVYIRPIVDVSENDFSGTISGDFSILYIPYNFFKGKTYKLEFICTTGTESVTNCLRVHTATVQNMGSAYKQDVINGATSLNPLCGRINTFGTGDTITETFVATKKAKWLCVLYYGDENTSYQITINVGRIASVEETDEILFGNGVVALNKDVEPYVLQLGREISAQTRNHGYKRLNFLFFSDIHRNGDLWERICDYMDEYSDIVPFAIHGGDYVSNDLSPSSIIDLYALRKPKNGAILNTVGNHDCYPAGESSTTATAQEVYSVLYQSVDPTTDGWDCTFGSELYAMYWYKDIADTGVRIICLDQYHWDSNQETFFTNALSDAKTNGLAVITVTHTPITIAVDDVGSGFWTLDNWALSDTYTGSMVNIRTAINSFVSNGGVYLINLCGHIHSDQFGKLTTDELLQFRTQTANAETVSSALWTDTNRVIGTKTYDCFNIIQVDRNLSMIKIVRIGCNSSDCLQPRTTLCWDYVNKKLISNT